MSASSEVKTVLPSICTPGGTNGTEPVARMTFLALSVLPPPSDTVLPSMSLPLSSKTVTPRPVSELPRFFFTVLARLFACAATFSRS